MRTQTEKIVRKENDKRKNKEYKYYYDHNNNILNTCVICKKKKKLINFVRNHEHRNKCKNCHKIKQRKNRQENPEKGKIYYKNIKRKNLEIIKKIKENTPCNKCGKIYPIYVMDFHHINMTEKIKNISSMYSCPNQIEKEIEKCEILCANCHREETQSNIKNIDVYKNRVYKDKIEDIAISAASKTKICKKCGITKNIINFTLLKTGKPHSYCKQCLRTLNTEYGQSRKLKQQFRQSKQYIIDQKDNKPCTDCKQIFRYWALDFDHIEDKYKSINTLQNRQLDLIKQEIKKCELLCANCHRIRTIERKAGFPFIRIDEIKDFLEKIGYDPQPIEIKNLHFEILVQNLIIEYVGFDYFNRDLNKLKYQSAIQTGYQYLCIFEDEWRDKKENVQNLLINKLNLNKPQSIRPNHCEIKLINIDEANLLYHQYHYIGKCNSKINYGVFYQNTLIAGISFSHPTRQSKHEWELIRMCSHSNYRVHGIWSKLLKKFITDHHPSSIVSFSDNRLFDGKVYEKIGFKADGEIPSDYYWIKNKQRFHKSRLRKTKEEILTGLTETQLREAVGYQKIWDLGKKRWLLIR